MKLFWMDVMKLTISMMMLSMVTSGQVFAEHQGEGAHCKMHTKVSFEEADKDQNGSLDRNEAKLICKEKFEVMDANKDGVLSKSEVNLCGRKK